jgi:cytochrome c551/c552
MEILNNLLSAPGTQQMELLKYLIPFMLMVHLPYAGMVIVSSALSLAHKPASRPFSRNLANMIMGGPWIILIFGLLPLMSLGFLLKLILSRTTLPILVYILRLLLPAILGFGLLHRYRRSESPLVGLGGVAVLLFTYLNFYNIMALLIAPEQWPFSRSPFPVPFSITFIIHYFQFLVISVILTGAAILFIYFRWEEKKLPEESEFAGVHRHWGGALVLGGSLALPALVLWDLYTIPPASLSTSVFLNGAAMLVVLFILSLLSLNILRKKHTRHATVIFILSLGLFAAAVLKDHRLFRNASREDLAVWRMQAMQAEEADRLEREKTYRKAVKADAKLGEEIFNQRCTACHAFDRRILGPPYNEVVPKYIGRADDLMGFLREPQKVDPDYPAMPDPGLREYEIESVTRFLLARYGQTPEGEQGEK